MMAGFTSFETAALRAIFSETPEFAAALERQFELAEVNERENTGGGFFTTMRVHDETLAIDCPRVLGDQVYAQVNGLNYGFGMILFMESGLMHLLEGYAVGPECTSLLDLEKLLFSISTAPPG